MKRQRIGCLLFAGLQAQQLRGSSRLEVVIP